MTDKKLTDEEVVGILNACANKYTYLKTEYEKQITIHGIPISTLLSDVLDLINRQNNEIDMLISKKEALRDEIAQQQAEIEELKAQIKTLLDVEKCS